MDYDFSEIPEARTDGNVFIDSNDNGIFDSGERGIPGVTVTITGVDVFGDSVSRTTTTGADGYYEFTGLYAGVYDIDEVQPQQFFDGQEQTGSAPVIVSNDSFRDLNLQWGDNTFSYNFGELPNVVTPDSGTPGGTTSGNPPVFPALPPIIGGLIGPILGDPGPLYSGVPMFSFSDPFGNFGGGPVVTGGYSLENRLFEECCCEEVVDPCGCCEEPVVVDACGQEVVASGCPVECETVVTIGPEVNVIDVAPDEYEVESPPVPSSVPAIIAVDEINFSEPAMQSEETQSEPILEEDPAEDQLPPLGDGLDESVRIDESESNPMAAKLPSFLQRFASWLSPMGD